MLALRLLALRLPALRLAPSVALVVALSIVPGSRALAQENPPQPQPGQPHSSAQPQIKVNFLNTCRPAQADVEEMDRALARVKERPVFSSDFEVSRGRTTLSEAEARAAGAPPGSGLSPSSWVRIQKEFPEKAVLTDAQYSLSVDGSSTSEVLALHLRDSKEVLQILISDSVVGTAAQVWKARTPPDRIRIERFGKPSIVLARCGGIDQTAHEATFSTAGEILERYRAAMAVKAVVPAELSRLPGPKESKVTGKNH